MPSNPRLANSLASCHTGDEAVFSKQERTRQKHQFAVGQSVDSSEVWTIGQRVKNEARAAARSETLSPDRNAEQAPDRIIYHKQGVSCRMTPEASRTSVVELKGEVQAARKNRKQLTRQVLAGRQFKSR
jgi:hypothetical protein